MINKDDMKDFTKSVFLTKDGFGITATSANYLANLSQEVIAEKRTSLENIKFLSSRIISPLCPEGLDYEKANYDLSTIAENIREIGNLNAFCGWMREGIHAKEEAVSKINAITFDEWAKDKEIEIPKVPELEKKTEDDFKNELSIGERLTYLRAEAIASAFGKMIHQDCPISVARQNLIFHKTNPIKSQGRGQDLIVYRYTCEADTAEVDAVFLKLQNEQREHEKQVNHYKSLIAKQMNEHSADSSMKHAAELKDYQTKMDILQSQFKAYIAEEREKVNQMKVTVPDALMDTYKYLNGLGK